MRVGQNPARFVEKVAQPAEITVAVVNCIPFLSGYYENCLEVLQTVVESLHTSREQQHSYDVMVFDNHSCAEVRAYLQEGYEQGKIQYLVLSDTNIGKLGAWNFMFGAAQGKYIVFSDGDVAFRPGWLKASLDLFDTFPNVGMVTARPYRASNKFSDSTLEWAHKQDPGMLEEGKFIPWETFWEHAKSIGFSEEQARTDYLKDNEYDYKLTYKGKIAYIGAGHFQFMARRDVLQKIIPLPSVQPMRGERALDEAVDKLGYLRLTTETPLIWHIGNRLPVSDRVLEHAQKRATLLKRLLHLPGIRHFLLWIYNQIFRLYFDNIG
jgi:glycosyltransferase involved in cell wall biosynthesis